LGLLEAAATADEPARVINVGSIDGLRVPELESYAYSASKAAVHHLTRHLARTLTPRHINVNAIAPGLFPTKMTAFMFEDDATATVSQIPAGRAGRDEDMAGVALYLASRAGAYTTGAVIPVDGGAATLR
ncbi:MAG: SDR family oxidoreductase, partial [Nitriliruptoraceae bacterium]